MCARKRSHVTLQNNRGVRGAGFTPLKNSGSGEEKNPYVSRQKPVKRVGDWKRGCSVLSGPTHLGYSFSAVAKAHSDREIGRTPYDSIRLRLLVSVCRIFLIGGHRAEAKKLQVKQLSETDSRSFDLDGKRNQPKTVGSVTTCPDVRLLNLCLTSNGLRGAGGIYRPKCQGNVPVSGNRMLLRHQQRFELYSGSRHRTPVQFCTVAGGSGVMFSQKAPYNPT